MPQPAASAEAVHEFADEATLRAAVMRQVDDELNRYWQLKPPASASTELRPDDDDQLEPLVYWRTRGRTEFPRVAEVARAFLSAQITSAMIERVFSIAKFWTRDERSCLGDASLNMCVFLAATFNKLFKGKNGPQQLDVTSEAIYRGNPFIADADAPASASAAPLPPVDVAVPTVPRIKFVVKNGGSM